MGPLWLVAMRTGVVASRTGCGLYVRDCMASVSLVHLLKGLTTTGNEKRCLDAATSFGIHYNLGLEVLRSLFVSRSETISI